MSKPEKAAYVVIALLIALGSYLSHFHYEAFRERYVMEDGPLESATAILLFATGMLIFLTFGTAATVARLIGAGEPDVMPPQREDRHIQSGAAEPSNRQIGLRDRSRRDRAAGLPQSNSRDTGQSRAKARQDRRKDPSVHSDSGSSDTWT